MSQSTVIGVASLVLPPRGAASGRKCLCQAILGEVFAPDSQRWHRAAAVVFDEKQLADLTLAIALMNAYNRIAISFRATPIALANGVPEELRRT